MGAIKTQPRELGLAWKAAYEQKFGKYPTPLRPSQFKYATDKMTAQEKSYQPMIEAFFSDPKQIAFAPEAFAKFVFLRGLDDTIQTLDRFTFPMLREMSKQRSQAKGG